MLESVISRFAIPGRPFRSGRFGSGLINDTYLCEFDADGAVRKYILQRINATVFPHPEEVMQNVETVTRHLQERLRGEGVEDPESVTPALVLTSDGHSFLRDATGGIWRMFHFIETGEVFDTVRGPEHAFETGRALGRFQALASDLPPDTLHDTLPGFHHTPLSLAQYDRALGAASAGRCREAVREMRFAEKRRGLAGLLTGPMQAGGIPLRVVHNDPKVNNVLVHRETGRAICMLDLDTVKPGIVHFDIGDCVRSAANPAGEDAGDLGSVRLDLALAKSIVTGYLREARAFLTPEEIRLLPDSVKVITYELGLRFLADHLRCDTYFKVSYPGHNLHRARVQFRLLESIEEQEKGLAEAFQEGA